MGPRVQPTDQGLDCGKLIKILQELVQGVTVVWCDGVLVLEQELDSARDESVAKGDAKGEGGRASQERHNALHTREGMEKIRGLQKDKLAGSRLFPCLEKTGQEEGSCVRGRIQRNVRKCSRKVGAEETELAMSIMP